MKQELTQDLTLIRSELRDLLPLIKDKKISLKKATVTIYCCSNFIRAIVAQDTLNKIEQP